MQLRKFYVFLGNFLLMYLHYGISYLFCLYCFTDSFQKNLYPVKIESFSRFIKAGHYLWPYSICMVGKDLTTLFDVENCSKRTSLFSRNCKHRKQELMSKWLWLMSTEKLLTSSIDTKCPNS